MCVFLPHLCPTHIHTGELGGGFIPANGTVGDITHSRVRVAHVASERRVSVLHYGPAAAQYLASVGGDGSTCHNDDNANPACGNKGSVKRPQGKPRLNRKLCTSVILFTQRDFHIFQ